MKKNFARTIRQWLPVFLTSGVGLFLEMAVVRWIAAEVRLMAYFKNLPLLAAFLGLSIGFAYAGRKRDYMPAFVPLLGFFVVLVLAVGRILSPRSLAYPGGGDEFLWFTGDFSFWVALGLFLAVVVLFFVSTMLLFIPLGQAIGREMSSHPPVPAYIVNLLGSLAGIWAFALISHLQSPPAVWFGLAAAGLGFYLSLRQSLSPVFVTLGTLVVAALAISGKDIIWSPYQRLDVVDLYLNRDTDGEPIHVGYTLKVQQVFYLVALDLSDEFLARLGGRIPMMEDAALSYNLPYHLARRESNVLVVGAGMGNDAAAALRAGARRVEAVEIDPAIAELGARLHPERPYDDPRVRVVIDDARSFLQRTPAVYDVIVFGFLDSHTLLSGLSSVRLDSFVYTLESFEQVRSHLAENGVVTLSFAVGAPWIEERIGNMLVEVFGSEKVFVQNPGLTTTFAVGSFSPQSIDQNHLALWQPRVSGTDVPLATDDWPYLYMRTRRVPSAYWQALLVVGLACVGLIARSFPEALRPNWHFWLLGAAFLLVEFKAITELALLFGTTWLVNVIAITGVLVMALAANLVVLKLPRLNLGLAYSLLLASLAIAYFLPLKLLVGLPVAVRALGGPALLSLPLFFAGLIFSESLRRAGETAGPLASNLSGSVAGGVLEYGSLLWGIKSLYVIAAAVYVFAWVASRIQRR